MLARFRLFFLSLVALVAGVAHAQADVERVEVQGELTLATDWYDGFTGQSEDGRGVPLASLPDLVTSPRGSPERFVANAPEASGDVSADTSRFSSPRAATIALRSGAVVAAGAAAFLLADVVDPVALSAMVGLVGITLADVDKKVDEIAANQKALADRNAELEAEKAKGDRSEDEVNAEMNKRFDDLMAKVEEVQSAHQADRKAFADALQNSGRPGVQGIQDEIEAKASEAFDVYARRGERALTLDQHEAITTGYAAARELSTDDLASGGVLVPGNTTDRIIERVYERSPIRANATVETINQGDRLPIVREGNDDYSSGWVGERETRQQTEAETFGLVIVDAHEQFAEPVLTNKMLEDAGVNVEARLERGIANRMALQEGIGFVTGNGINKPLGLLSVKTVAEFDALQHLFKSGNATGVPDWKVYAKAMTKLPSQYQEMAKWYWHRTSTFVAMTFLDGQDRPLINFDLLREGGSMQFLGHDVVHVDAMPAYDLEAGTYTTADIPVLFADMEEAYTVLDRRGMVILRDQLTKKGFTKFYTTRRVGGTTVQPAAVTGVRVGA